MANNLPERKKTDSSDVGENALHVMRIDEAIAGLPEEQRGQMQEKLVEGLIEVNVKAATAATEAAELAKNLDTVVDNVVEATKAGAAITLHHTQTGTNSETKAMTGNTEKAKSGLGVGGIDWKPIYILIGIISLALVIIALVNNL